VVDSAHPFHDNQIDVVKKTLVDIGAGNIPTILVLNKIDKLQNEDGPVDLDSLRGYYSQHGFENVVFISATQKENIQPLRQMIFEEVKKKHLMIYPNYVSSTFG
jgi:GTP-binding protein HflX